MKIYIMRHGQSKANVEQTVSGQLETPLSQFGRHQVALTVPKIAKLGIDLIACSPLIRAKDTAVLIAEGIGYAAEDIMVLNELKERGLGALESKSYAKDERLSGNFIETEKFSGIEPIESFHSRVQLALRTIMATRKSVVLIVCHMNVGRMLKVIAKGGQPLDVYTTPRLENSRVEKLL